MTERSSLQQLERDACGAIRTAFPNSDPPTPIETEIDHCPECREVHALFTGKRWVDVTVDDLRGNPPVSLLTASLFRYYLPALMLRCIEAAEVVDCVPAAVVGMLSPPNGKPTERLADLRRSVDESQRRAIRRFLAVFEAREKWDRYSPEAFESAPVSKPLARAIAYWSGGEKRE